MANHLMSLFFAFNLLMIISAHGRVFQKNNTNALSISDIKVKVVSLQDNGSYTGQTNSDDVQGLVELVTPFPWLKESNLEDPCLAPKWTWIECNSDAKPRIIALNLYNKLLVGYLPDFSSMKALQIIDVSQNALIGNVPSFLGTFPNLQELNLANNLFSGYIPDSIACNNKLKLSVASNAGLTLSDKCTTNLVDSTAVPTTDTTYTYTYTYRKKSNVGAIAGSISSVFLLISIGVGIFAIFRHRANTAAAIAAANAGTLPNDQKINMPAEEMPMNSRPTNISP